MNKGDWRPIARCPLKKWVFVTDGNRVTIARRERERWEFVGREPAHEIIMWMPLDPAPFGVDTPTFSQFREEVEAQGDVIAPAGITALREILPQTPRAPQEHYYTRHRSGVYHLVGSVVKLEPVDESLLWEPNSRRGIALRAHHYVNQNLPQKDVVLKALPPEEAEEVRTRYAHVTGASNG